MKKFIICGLLAGLLLALVAGQAFAHSGSEPAVTTAPKENTKQQTQTVSGQIRARTAPAPEAGGAAGDSSSPLAFWGEANLSFFNYGLHDERYRANTLMMTGGVDYAFGDFLIGSALTLEKGWATDNNAGGFIDYSSYGAGIIPYVAYSLTDWLVFDASFGYTAVQNHMEQTGLDSANYGSMRSFVSGNANAYYELGSVIINPNIGYTYSHARQDAIHKDNVTWAEVINSWSGQWRFGVDALYAVNDKTNLNGGIAYLYENTGGSTSNYRINGRPDQDEFELSLGLNRAIQDDFKMGVQTALTLEKEGTSAGNIGVTFELLY